MDTRLWETGDFGPPQQRFGVLLMYINFHTRTPYDIIVKCSVVFCSPSYTFVF